MPRRNSLRWFSRKQQSKSRTGCSSFCGTREKVTCCLGKKSANSLRNSTRRVLHLHTIYRMSGPQQVVRPEDVPVHAEIIEWFSGKTRVAEQMFLKYIDFREP